MFTLTFPGLTEQVIRHRGAGRDENGQLTTATDEPLTTIAVAPGAGSHYVEQSRDGETTAYTVYFTTGTDITNSDELTVRGERFSIIVKDWRSSSIGGLEVQCTRGQG